MVDLLRKIIKATSYLPVAFINVMIG